MTEKLKPCPFCGSETAHVLIVRDTANHMSCSQTFGGCGSSGPFVADKNDSVTAWNKRAVQAKDLAALRAFAQAVMDCWPDGWGVEGDELQHIAAEHGMLRPEIRNDPCGDGCRCADHVLPNEWRDGVTCYRKTALLTGADHD